MRTHYLLYCPFSFKNWTKIVLLMRHDDNVHVCDLGLTLHHSILKQQLFPEPDDLI